MKYRDPRIHIICNNFHNLELEIKAVRINGGRGYTEEDGIYYYVDPCRWCLIEAETEGTHQANAWFVPNKLGEEKNV
jgi:hypothetical protein